MPTEEPVEEPILQPPPPPVKAPPVPRGKGPVQPIEYTTTTTQTVRPLEKTPEEQPQPNYLENVPVLHRRFAQYLWKMYNEEPKNWRLHIKRLPEQIDIPNQCRGPYEDLVAFLQSLTPAKYRVRIKVNEINITDVGCDPIFDFSEQEQQGISPGAAAFLKRINPVPESNDPTVDELRRKRHILSEKAETEAAQREYERRREQADEERDRRASAPVEALKAELAELKGMFKDLMAKVSNPPPPPMDPLVIVKELGSVFAQIAKPQDSTKDIAMMMIENNKSSIAMQIEQMKELRTTLEKQAGNPQEQMKFYMSLQQQGEERAMKMMEYMNPPEKDDVEIDPSNVWGSLAAEGVKTLISAFKSGGPEIIKMIASRVGKPAEQVTEGDLANLAQRLHHVPPVAAPVRQAQQFLPNPQPSRPLPVASNPPERFDPLAPTVQPKTVTVNKPVPSTELPQEVALPSAPPTGTGPLPGEVPIATVSADSTGVSAAPVVQASPAASTSQQTTAIPPQDPLARIEDPLGLSREELADLIAEVDYCLRNHMVVDLKGEKPEHYWPQYAFENWPKSFKMALVLAETVEEKMNFVRKYADPKLCDEILTIWKKPGSVNEYIFGLAWNSVFTTLVMTPAATESPAQSAPPAPTQAETKPPEGGTQ
jgi:hypothetical protein